MTPEPESANNLARRHLNEQLNRVQAELIGPSADTLRAKNFAVLAGVRMLAKLETSDKEHLGTTVQAMFSKHAQAYWTDVAWYIRHPNKSKFRSSGAKTF